MSSELKIDDPAARELPAIRAAWPAWTLAAIALLTFFLQIARGTADDPDGLRGLTLSATSLGRGEWWTLVTHAFVQHGFFGHIAALIVFVSMGLSTLGAHDKAWMGGWRTLGVFALASAAGAAVHFLSGRQEDLTGMWQGAAGLALFYLASGRWPRPPAGAIGKANRSERLSSALSTWCSLSLCAAIGPLQDARTDAGWSGLVIPAAVFVAGLAVIFAVNRWGSRRLEAIVNAGMLCLIALMAVLYLLSMLADEPPIAWAALAGGAVMGLTLGFVDRSWARVTSAAD